MTVSILLACAVWVWIAYGFVKGLVEWRRRERQLRMERRAEEATKRLLGEEVVVFMHDSVNHTILKATVPAHQNLVKGNIVRVVDVDGSENEYEVIDVRPL
jgi:hypothetical protein